MLRQGSRSGRVGGVVGHHALHVMADGGNARDDPWEASGPIPRARAGGVRAEARAMDRGAATAHRAGRSRHCVHGDGR